MTLPKKAEAQKPAKKIEVKATGRKELAVGSLKSIAKTPGKASGVSFLCLASTNVVNVCFRPNSRISHQFQDRKSARPPAFVRFWTRADIADLQNVVLDNQRGDPMTKPIPDKAEIALEYPDKLYVGTFERSSRFEAHVDPTGIALILERPGADDIRKSIHMHINFGLFADILRDLASTIGRIPKDDVLHHDQLAQAVTELHRALVGSPAKQ